MERKRGSKRWRSDWIARFQSVFDRSHSAESCSWSISPCDVMANPIPTGSGSLNEKEAKLELHEEARVLQGKCTIPPVYRQKLKLHVPPFKLSVDYELDYNCALSDRTVI